MNYFFSLLFIVSLAAHASKEAPWTTNLYFENDLFSETDQNYTNGIRISLVSPDIASFETDEQLPQWLRSINDQLHFFHNLRQGLTRNVVVSLGQQMFTPENDQASGLLESERPYAGWLYLGFAYHTRSDDQLDIVEVNLGIVGPDSRAKETQNFIHDLRGLDKFQGWDNQLKNELGIQFIYEHKHRLFDQTLLGRIEQDFIGHFGGSVGNVGTYVNFGGEYRVGLDLPDDFGTSAVRPGGDNSAPGRKDPRLRHSYPPFSGLHTFVFIDARLIAHSIFLDGNSYRDSHSVDKEKEVADIGAGFSFLAGRWKISWAYVMRTREFKQQPRHQEYGSLSFSYTF